MLSQQFCIWQCFFLIKHFVDGVFLFLRNIENLSLFLCAAFCCVFVTFVDFLKNFMSFFDFINFMSSSSSSSSSSSKKGSLLGGANFLVQD
jgi:hypothetical protein